MKSIPLGEGYRGSNGRLGYLLRQAYQAMRAEIDRAAREHGLTAPQYSTLNVLFREPGLTGAEIARQSLLRPQTVNEITSSLEQRGLIERRRDGEDRRVRRAYLTAAGRRAFEMVDREVSGIEQGVLATATAGERRALTEGLVRCALALQQPDASRRG